MQYSVDNWLRCWFNGIDVGKISKEITVAKTVSSWSNFVGCAFKELHRVVKSDGWIAFEVGEVRRGSIELDEIVVPLGTEAGFKVLGIVINNQKFTKTANIWGINNNHFGTNTNRIVLFHKN